MGREAGREVVGEVGREAGGEVGRGGGEVGREVGGRLTAWTWYKQGIQGTARKTYGVARVVGREVRRYKGGGWGGA